MKSEIEISERSYRSAQVRSQTLDEDKRSVEVVFSSGAPVRRHGWDGDFVEHLLMTADAVDLGRMNSGACPLLDSHAAGSMADRLGAVEPGSARIEKGLGLCRVILSTSRSGSQVLSDLKAGLPLSLSIGYRVTEFERAEGDDDELPTLTATQWEVLEVSCVPIPADAAAKARGQPAEHARHTVQITTRRAQGAAGKEHEMTTVATIDRAAVDDEIRQLAETYDVSTRVLRKAIEGKKSVPEFREMILDSMRANQEKNPIFSIAPQPHQERGQGSLADALSDAILARVLPGHEPSQAAGEFIGLSMAEMARAALSARGEGTRGVRPSELISRSLHTTSDFSLALSTVASRLVRTGYEASPSQIRRIAKETSAKDFRAKTSVQFAEGGTLEKVNEHGEFRRGTFAESGETYAIGTYGKIFGLTRQALINDDLGILEQLPSRLGGYASRFESQFLAKLLESPPKMSDGKNLFHADHGNLASTPALLSQGTLSAARLAMRRQKGIAGEVITVEPKFLVVPPELEFVAEQLVAAVNAEKIDNVNPFGDGRISVVVEPHLISPIAWYLSAGPSETGFEYAYLEGAAGPQVETRQGFDIDGSEWKVRLDFGGGFVDWRGIYKNPGIAP